MSVDLLRLVQNLMSIRTHGLLGVLKVSWV